MKSRWLLPFLCFVVSLGGCQEMKRQHQQVRTWMEENGKIKVLCTTAFVADLAESVGGDQVDVLVLVSGQNDPHSYRIVKGDDEKFRRADVVFSSGLGLEQGTTLARYLSSYDACAVGECIAHRTRGVLFTQSVVDPHIWMDISLWSEGAKCVSDRLTKIRPESAEVFQKNGAETVNRLMELHGRVQQLLQQVPADKRYLVTTHDAFYYFCRAYLATAQERQSEEWRKRCIAPEGFAPESQISTQDLNEVVAYILAHRVHTLFAEEGMNRDSLQKIVKVCADKGHHVILSHDSLYSDTMGSGMTYEKMMEHNAQAIYEAFQL